MDVDFISDLDEKKDKTEVSKASTTLPTHRHAKQFSLTSVSTSQRYLTTRKFHFFEFMYRLLNTSLFGFSN